MKSKNLKFIVICLIFGLLGTCVWAAPTYAASKARNAYSKLLEDKGKLKGLSAWNNGTNWSKAEYAIIDANQDGVPELLVRSNKMHGTYHMMLVAYVNGKAKCIGHAPVGTTTGNGGITLYPKGKTVCLTTYKNNWKHQGYYKFNGKTLEEKCGSMEQQNHMSYNIKGKQVAKNKFMSYKTKLLNVSKAAKIKWKKANPGKTDKTAYYSAVSNWWAQLTTGRKDFISGISYKGNTVTIRGALMKAPSFGKRGTLLKNKSRTFKMTKYCEYHYADGRMSGIRLSKKKFFQTCKNKPSFHIFQIYTNSKGEIYHMNVDYSM